MISDMRNESSSLRTKSAAALAALSLFGLLAGCSDDSSNVEDDMAADASMDMDANVDEGDGGPLFALASQVLTGDSPVTYVLLSDEITSAPSFDDAVVEVTGRGLVFAGPEEGVFFVGGNSAGTLTKYRVDSAEKVTEVGELSFSGEGVTAIGEYQTNMYFVSADKAYYFDGGSAQVIVWNPQEMTITDTLSLSGLLQDGTVLSFSSVPAVEVGDHLVMPAAYRAPDGASLPSLTAAVIVDTKNDNAVVITDDRCGYVRDAVLGDDGLVYLATEAWGAAVHRVSAASAPEPCMLRIDPEEEAYDADFHVELAGIADGATVGSLIKLPDGTVLTRVLDEDLATIDDATNPRVLAGMAVWGWAEVTLGDQPTLTQLDGAEPVLGSLLPFVADGEVYQPHFEMRTQTVIHAVSAQGAGEGSDAIDGLIFSAAQVK